MSNRRVSFLIVNFNGRDYLGELLESIERQSFRNFEVIFVDNGSTDGSVEWLRLNYPQVTLVEATGNLGFGRANNLAAQQATGEFLALVNTDIVLSPRWLEEMVKELESQPAWFAVGSKLCLYHFPQILNGVGGGVNEMGYSFDRGQYEWDFGQHDGDSECFFPCAAAALYRKNVFVDVGGFDSRFFMYHEDVDLAWRLHLAGWRCGLAPKATALHHFGGTTSRTIGVRRRLYLGERHLLRSLIKCVSGRRLPRLLWRHLRLRRGWRGRWLWLRNVWVNFLWLPETLKIRRLVQQTRRVDDNRLRLLMERNGTMPALIPDYPLTPPQNIVDRSRDIPAAYKMGQPPAGILSHGWHQVQHLNDPQAVAYRWSHADAGLFLYIPENVDTLHLEFYAVPRQSGVPVRGALWLDENQLGELKIDENGRNQGSWRLPADCRGKTAWVRFRSIQTWCPDRIFHNGDSRQLGFGLISIATRRSKEQENTGSEENGQ